MTAAIKEFWHKVVVNFVVKCAVKMGFLRLILNQIKSNATTHKNQQSIDKSGFFRCCRKFCRKIVILAHLFNVRSAVSLSQFDIYVVDSLGVRPAADAHGLMFRPAQMIGQRRKRTTQPVYADSRQPCFIAGAVYLNVQDIRRWIMQERRISITALRFYQLRKAGYHNRHFATR